jgi:hypothetical protein
MRQRREMKLKTSFRRVAWVSSALVGVLAIGLTLFFNFSSNEDAYAAVTNEYRTKASGNWSSTATWQRYNGSSWVNATSTPTSSAATITILSGHTVTITSSVAADQIVVNSGGTLVQNSGITLTVNNGSGTDLAVSGTFKNAGTVTISASAIVVFQSSGKYQHNFTTSGGTIPTATWNSGSTCEIIGFTTYNNSLNGCGQAFSNFVWNCPLQLSWVDLNSALTNVTGDFTITSTGLTGGLRLSKNPASTLSVGGDFTFTAGNFSLSDGSNITSVMNVAGDYTHTLGSFSIVDGSGSTGNVNVSGNYTHTAGTLTVGGNSSTSAVISFARSGSQTFTTTLPVVTGNVDWKINSGSTLVMGSSIMYGRNFTLSAGGGLSMGSLLGISATGLLGNIQVSGTRSYSTGADYVYSGGATQNTGGGIPATVRNLTVNNGGTLTMSTDFTVTGVLNLANGKINTGSNTLYVTNTSTSSITGYSSADYIIGNLNRSVGSSGTYDYPLGTTSNYELLTLKLSGTAGFSNVLGKFTSADPNDASYDLDSITASGVHMSELLDYGSWTLTPNSNLTSGTFTVTLNEDGYSNTILDGTVITLANRANLTSQWLPAGTHDDANQSVVSGVATAERSTLTRFGIFAIAIGDFPMFANPTLRSGTAGAVNAIYVFPIVVRGVDAWVEIMNLSNGATLDNIDNSAVGYNSSFQPFINYPAGRTAYIEWKITFKKAGTSTDTTIKRVTATGVDVDGNSNVREFIEATMPLSYNLDPFTNLTVTNLGGSYRALGYTNDISNIDSSRRQAMYELNYVNVNTLMYRTGAINVSGSSQTRQTSLFFKAFYLTNKNIALPIKLISFDAKLRNNNVSLTWATAAEINNDFFTIERSTDGQTFEPILTKRGAGNSTVTLEYEANDPNPLDGYSYYRLKQTDYDGHFSYSDVETVKNKGGQNDIDEAEVEITAISPNPFSDEFKIDFILKQKCQVEVSMISSKGEMIFNEAVMAEDGYNSFSYTDNKGLTSGYYFVIITYKDQKVTKKIMKM